MKTGSFIKIVKIIIIALLIVVFASISYMCYAESNDYLGLLDHSAGAVYEINYHKPTSKKAMLLIPGLMASTLYDIDSGKPLWGYGGIVNMGVELFKIQISNASLAEKETSVQGIINRLACDENNVPLVREKVGTMGDGDAYGSFDGMKYIYDILEPAYGKQYDVIVWQYDWRQSNQGSAVELEKFINYHGYDELMFFTHSMGGVVVSNFLARSVENRNKTKLFMPFGCPLLGSMDAINNLYESVNLEGMIANALSMLKDNFNIDFSLNSLARNLASVYELLPFPAFDEVDYFKEDSISYVGSETAMHYEGQSVKCDEMLEKMYTYSWTKKANGESMPVVAGLEGYFEHLYVEVNGKRLFVTDTVSTEYIVGLGLNTLVGAYVNKDGILEDKVYSELGDGTVPAFSATAGHALTDENVHLVYGISHGPLANGDDLEGNSPEFTGLKYVRGIMEKYIEKTDSQIAGGN